MRFCQQFVLLVTLMLIATAYSVAHIVDSETGLNFQYNAKFTEVAPVVDGFLDDPIWEEVELGKMEQDLIKNAHWNGSNDFKGEFAAVWRKGFLYLAVKLTDDSLETRQTKLSRQDHLVIYIDPNHSGHKSDLYRSVVPVGKSVPLANSPLTMVAWGDNGQSCELSFNLGHIAKKGESIGFSIYYNDVDGGQVNHKIAWGPEGYADQDNFLPDLVFTAAIKRNENQKVTQWARIKKLY